MGGNRRSDIHTAILMKRWHLLRRAWHLRPKWKDTIIRNLKRLQGRMWGNTDQGNKKDSISSYPCDAGACDASNRPQHSLLQLSQQHVGDDTTKYTTSLGRAATSQNPTGTSAAQLARRPKTGRNNDRGDVDRSCHQQLGNAQVQLAAAGHARHCTHPEAPKGRNHGNCR